MAEISDERLALIAAFDKAAQTVRIPFGNKAEIGPDAWLELQRAFQVWGAAPAPDAAGVEADDAVIKRAYGEWCVAQGQVMSSYGWRVFRAGWDAHAAASKARGG
jgi:hypothetical protein